MRNFQFWILLLGSFVITGLMVKEILLSRAVFAQQRVLVDEQETSSMAAAYQNTWKQLAVHIYQASRQDPALADLLKKDHVTISTTPPAKTPPPAPAPAAPASAPAPATSTPAPTTTSP